MEKLDPDDPRPPFRVLTDALRSDIDAGRYAPGAQLPSYQGLADTYDVSVSTAKSAVGQLRAEGLVVTRHGKGSFVRTHAVLPDEGGRDTDALAELRDQMAEVLKRLAALERRVGVK